MHMSVQPTSKQAHTGVVLKYMLISPQHQYRLDYVVGPAACWQRLILLTPTSPRLNPIRAAAAGEQQPSQNRSQSYTSQIHSPWPSFLTVTHPPEPHAAARHTNGSLIIEMKLTHLTGRERGSVMREKMKTADKGSRGEIRERHVPFLNTTLNWLRWLSGPFIVFFHVKWRKFECRIACFEGH